MEREGTIVAAPNTLGASLPSRRRNRAIESERGASSSELVRAYRTRQIPCVRCRRISRSHLSSQPLTIPSPRGVLAAILDWRMIHGILLDTSGNVFESLPAREGPSSAVFENSRNLASSCGLRPDITGNTMVPEREMRREPQNSSILVPCCPKRRAGIKKHTGDSFNGMMDYLRIQFSEMHLRKFH